MKITVNGTSETLPEGPLEIERLLQLFEVKMPDMVSVQLNGEFVERVKYSATHLKDGDEVDFLYFMGGGSW